MPGHIWWSYHLFILGILTFFFFNISYMVILHSVYDNVSSWKSWALNLFLLFVSADLISWWLVSLYVWRYFLVKSQLVDTHPREYRRHLSSNDLRLSFLSARGRYGSVFELASSASRDSLGTRFPTFAFAHPLKLRFQLTSFCCCCFRFWNCAVHYDRHSLSVVSKVKLSAQFLRHTSHIARNQ